MGLPTESVAQEYDDADLSATRKVWDEEIERRVEQLRNGTAGHELLEVLAELDRCDAELLELGSDELEDDADDPAEIEAAWADEIETRIREMQEGTVPTYAAEDVLAVLHFRYG
jgi:hypothetical protein